MKTMLPEYLAIPPEQIGDGVPVTVRIKGDMNDMACDMAQVMLDEICQAKELGKAVTMIVPVGPVDQFPILAEMINSRKLDCRDVTIINMDEYLTEDDCWIDEKHPLSLRGHMKHKFYDNLDPDLAPRLENRVFPHPENLDEIPNIIEQRGGVDVTFGGIGINGHIAFNEPEPSMANDAFTALPTRLIDVTPHSQTIQSVNIGGEIDIIPKRGITVGMREILASKRLRFYCNRTWQQAVVRRVLHGPLTAACPASFLRTHADASLTMTDYVAALPEIHLR